jgi:hypothetical protein
LGVAIIQSMSVKALLEERRLTRNDMMVGLEPGEKTPPPVQRNPRPDLLEPDEGRHLVAIAPHDFSIACARATSASESDIQQHAIGLQPPEQSGRAS